MMSHQNGKRNIADLAKTGHQGAVDYVLTENAGLNLENAILREKNASLTTRCTELEEELTRLHAGIKRELLGEHD